MDEKKRKFLYALRSLIKIDKKGQLMEEMGKIIIYVALLLILLLIIIAFTNKGQEIWEAAKQFFTYGR